MCLLWGADLRLWHSWQISTSRIPERRGYQWGACSWFGGRCSLWGQDSSSPLPCNSGCCTTASLPLQRKGPLWQLSFSPLLFAQSFVLWACQGSPYGVRTSCGKGFGVVLFFCFCFCFCLVSLARFGLLSHISSLRLSSGNSGPVFTLRTSDEACAFPASPHSLLVDASIGVTSLVVVVVRCIFCGLFLFLFLFPGHVALWDSKVPHRHACKRVSYCVESSPPSWLPPQDESPSLNLLSLFSSFVFCPTSFQRDWAAILCARCPLPAFRSCFVKVAQHSNDLLMNLLGRKWSLHPIPLPSWDHL